MPENKKISHVHGSVNLIKMGILPKAIYRLSTIPSAKGPHGNTQTSQAIAKANGYSPQLDGKALSTKTQLV